MLALNFVEISIFKFISERFSLWLGNSFKSPVINKGSLPVLGR